MTSGFRIPDSHSNANSGRALPGAFASETMTKTMIATNRTMLCAAAFPNFRYWNAVRYASVRMISVALPGPPLVVM